MRLLPKLMAFLACLSLSGCSVPMLAYQIYSSEKHRAMMEEQIQLGNTHRKEIMALQRDRLEWEKQKFEIEQRNKMAQQQKANKLSQVPERETEEK